MKSLISAFFLSASFVALAVDVAEVRVKALDGFGGDTSSVSSRCQVKVGKTYDAAAVTRDVTSLKDSGEFDEITTDVKRLGDGVSVTYFVKRKMRFAGPLRIEGNEEFSESKISSESGLKDGFLYGESDLSAAAAKVRLAYQKKYYHDAKVLFRTEVLGGNDVAVTFVISEGKRQKIAAFEFRGAVHAVEVPFWSVPTPGFELAEDQFDAAELHAAINDYPWWNPIGWFSDNPITRDQQVQSCDKLAEVYRNHGYLDVKVTGPERIAVEDGEVKIVYTVEEGVQYRIGKSSVKGLTRYPENVVVRQSALPEAGAIAGRKALDEAAHRVEVAVGSGDLGLADTRVVAKWIPTADSSVVNIVYQVTEGVPVVINDIKIRGNDYTQDRVVRREIALAPGDRMLADRAERSQRRLENLDYFSRVRYYLEVCDRGRDANGAEYRNLVYEVEEKNTGSFMVGIGASTVDSVYVSAEVNQNNFDLFAPGKLFRGAGQKGRVYVAWGPRYQSAEVGFVEPHLFSRHLELSVDAYRRLRWYDQYDLIRTGAMGTLSYPVKFWPTWEPFGRFGFGVSADYIEFDDVEGWFYTKDFRTSRMFLDEERDHGDAVEPLLHLFWTKDSRDNYRIPTRGHKTRVFGALGPGPDNKYWHLGVNHRSYFNVWKRFNHVLMAGARVEVVDALSGEVPIYNRMFLGGPRSIRGIRYRHVAPMVRNAYSFEYVPWGGQTLFCMNFEYTIPVVKMLRFAVFSDLGSVGEDSFDFEFSDTFAWTVGLGARLDMPMFPIRLDFATPLTTPDHAEEEVFSFTVGYDF